MTHKSTWKNQEREAAKALGGTRAPCSGSYLSDHTDVEDVIISGHEILVSCKYRASMLVVTEWEETNINAKKTNKIPILLLKTKYLRGQLVVMHLDDFRRLVRCQDTEK